MNEVNEQSMIMVRIHIPPKPRNGVIPYYEFINNYLRKTNKLYLN